VSEIETIRFPVAGMTCSSCVSRITRVVRRLEGVTQVHVDLRRETATVRREPALVSNAALAAAVEAAGYEADLTAVAVVQTIGRRSLLDRLRLRLRRDGHDEAGIAGRSPSLPDGP
jgi:copper chaperone CopZ